MRNPFRRRGKAAEPAIESLSDDALVARVAAHGVPFDHATFADPEALLGWLCAHARYFDRHADEPPAVRAATGIDAFARWADEGQLDALAGEQPERWAFLGFGEQTYLYWDRSALPALRVLELDHEQRLGDVVMHDWRGARAVLLGLWARRAPGVLGVQRGWCYCSLPHHAPDTRR